MLVAVPKRFRVALVCILIVCLPQPAMMNSWLAVWHGDGSQSKPFFFIPAPVGGSHSIIFARMRSQLFNALDDLLRAALVDGRFLFVFTHESSSFSEPDADIFQSIDGRAIPIRAPPIYRFS